MTNQSSNQPVNNVRFGGVQAAIWRNVDNEGRRRYNVTVEKRYKDRDGEWQLTNSFNREELPLLAKVADTAHTRIFELQAEDRERSENGSDGAAKAKSRSKSRGATR